MHSARLIVNKHFIVLLVVSFSPLSSVKHNFFIPFVSKTNILTITMKDSVQKYKMLSPKAGIKKSLVVNH